MFQAYATDTIKSFIAQIAARVSEGTTTAIAVMLVDTEGHCTTHQFGCDAEDLRIAARLFDEFADSEAAR